MEKNITPCDCCMELKPSATPSGFAFQREAAAVPGRSLNAFTSRQRPRNTNKLGMQMQNPKTISTGNKSPAVLQLTAVRILSCYGMGQICIYNCQGRKKKRKHQPVNRYEKLAWGEEQEKQQSVDG